MHPKIVRSSTDVYISHASQTCIPGKDFVEYLLTTEPKDRPTAKEALKHKVSVKFSYIAHLLSITQWITKPLSALPKQNPALLSVPSQAEGNGLQRIPTISSAEHPLVRQLTREGVKSL